MAEFSGFWTTTGAPAGDQQTSYTQAQWSTATAVMTACNAFEGVAPNYLNSMAGTVTGANTVAINTGGAVVDGKYYNNSASVNVNIPSAVGGGNTRIDRIVLRASWAGFTVRITRIAGVDAGAPAAPAITQTAGTTYDIMLYQALVDTGGTVTLTDERVFSNCVIHHRQGNSATDWSSTGTVNYIEKATKIQCGCVASVNTVTVTFPEAFSNVPLVFLTPIVGAHSYMAVVNSVTATQVVINTYTDAGAGVIAIVSWLAIGPV